MQTIQAYLANAYYALVYDRTQGVRMQRLHTPEKLALTPWWGPNSGQDLSSKGPPSVPAKRLLPTVRLRRLASELCRLRASADLTREVVAERTGINAATLYRIETSKVRPQRRTLISLLDLYGVEEPQRSEVIALLKDADTQEWLRPYHADLPEEYTAYISFEAEASQVRNYESLFIPGLLQTEDYAHAVIAGVVPTASSMDVEHRVKARTDRQALLTRGSPLRLSAIVDEAALRRVVGGPDVMAAQLTHLNVLGAAPHITVQVIAFSAGAHVGMPGSFSLMSFPDSADPEIIYIDNLAGDLFLEAEADIVRFSSMFESLRTIALDPDDSAALITKLQAELSSGRK
jgi:transcriptional regulator with XRE-family HTH domain